MKEKEDTSKKPTKRHRWRPTNRMMMFIAMARASRPFLYYAGRTYSDKLLKKLEKRRRVTKRHFVMREVV